MSLGQSAASDLSHLFVPKGEARGSRRSEHGNGLTGAPELANSQIASINAEKL